LIEVVAGKLGLKPELICSGNRQRQYSEARSVLAWMAVEEVGHPAAEVARFLGISRVGVLLSLEKAKDICQKYELQLTPPNSQIQYVGKQLNRLTNVPHYAITWIPRNPKPQ